jgi:hypothetical protein
MCFSSGSPRRGVCTWRFQLRLATRFRAKRLWEHQSQIKRPKTTVAVTESGGLSASGSRSGSQCGNLVAPKERFAALKNVANA